MPPLATNIPLNHTYGNPSDSTHTSLKLLRTCTTSTQIAQVVLGGLAETWYDLRCGATLHKVVLPWTTQTNENAPNQLPRLTRHPPFITARPPNTNHALKDQHPTITQHKMLQEWSVFRTMCLENVGPPGPQARRAAQQTPVIDADHAIAVAANQ